MLYEFALDPEVLNNFYTVRYFLEKFGVHHGRLISKFPKKWKMKVSETCMARGDVEKKKIEEYLINAEAKLIKSYRIYDDSLLWLDNAEKQHCVRPFHAIISSANPRNIDIVLIADELTETNALWNVPREKLVSRKAEDLAKHMQPLFQISSEILFVDPHFDPNAQRYQNTLFQFVRVLNLSKVRRIEYHLSGKISKDLFKNDSIKYIPYLLPTGIEVKFIRWEQIDGGEALHPRYILTDKGGVRIDHGLDEGRDGEFTDVSLLDCQVYEKRWKDYQFGTPTFKYVDEIKITGI